MKQRLPYLIAGGSVLVALVFALLWWQSVRRGKDAVVVRQHLALARRIVAELRDDRIAILAAEEIDATEPVIGKAERLVLEGAADLALPVSERAVELAVVARERALARRRLMRTAVLSEIRNRVLHRPVDSVGWKDAELNMSLFDGDRVATKENAHAAVMFEEGNEMVVAPDSVVVVSKFSADHDANLDVQLSVSEGSVRSTTARVGKREVRMALRLPQADIVVDTMGLHGDGRVDVGTEVRGDDSARIAVYEGHAKLTTRDGDSVTMSRQYADVTMSGVLLEPRALPPTPSTISPTAGEQVFIGVHRTGVLFRWRSEEPCVQARLEVASDGKFLDLAVVQLASRDRFMVDDLPDGEFHWRVACVVDGVAGQFSAGGAFDVRHDKAAPGIQVLSPMERSVVAKKEILASCRTEPTARVFINGEEASSDGSGVFSRRIELKGGLNRVLFEAVDVAGNLSHERQFVTWSD